jgi:cell division protein FtsA
MSQIHIQNRVTGRSKNLTVASLDIGSTKISCMIAEVSASTLKSRNDPRSGLRVIGFGQTLSRGVRSGCIVDVDEAECAIRLAVDAAERMAGISISEVYVGISGGKPQSRSAQGRVRTQTGLVTRRDIDSSITVALGQVNVGKRKLLHVTPINHGLDGVTNVSTPLGMHGNVLSTDLSVTSVEPAFLSNLKLAVERAHLRAAGFIIAPYAAAKATLTADELALGTFVIDLGGALSSVGFFNNGQLVSADCLGLGGMHITNDIAQGLSTTIAHAERMKTLWGSVLPDGHGEREMLAVPALGERGVDTVHKVPKSHLTNILRPRVEEIFELVGAKISEMGQTAPGAGRVVLTGGASQLSGVRELAQAILGRHVRLGASTGFSHISDQAKHSSFAVAAGTLCYAARPEIQHGVSQEIEEFYTRAQMGYVRRVGQWLAEAL